MNTVEVLAGALLWGIAGSAVITIACALLVRLRHFRAGVAHAIWFAAIVLMGLLPIVAVGASFLRTTHAPSLHETPAKVVVVQSDTSHALPALGHAPETSGAPNLPTVPNDVTRILLILAAAGALAGTISVFFSLGRLSAIKRRSSPLDETLSHELPWLAETIEGRETYLRLSYEIETPIAIGFGRPVILIPTDLATENGLTAIESLVIHEHAHLRHYDDYTNLVQRFIERLYWFNPFVWYAGRQLALAREMSADDAVLARGNDRANYAQTLWRLAREMRMPSQPIVAPGALFTRKQISQRIEAILAANRGQLTPLDPTAIFIGITLACIAYGLVIWLTPAYRIPALPETALGVWPRGAIQVVLPTPGALELPKIDPPPIAPAPPATPEAAPTPASIAGRIRERIAGAFGGGSRHSRSLQLSCTTGCDYDGHDFRGVELRDLNFGGSSMDKANFTGARLRKIGFDGASLDGARFDGAVLDHVRFSGASVDGASFLGARFDHVSFSGVDLTAAHFDNEGLRSILASGCGGCDLSGLKMRGADLSGLQLSGVNMSGVDLSGANLRGVRFSGVQLDDAKLDNADLTGATLTGCSLSGASTTNAKLDHITLIGSSFN